MHGAEHHPFRIAAIIAIFVGLLAGGWWLRARASAKEPALHTEVALLDRGPLQAKVTATGTVNPIKTVTVGSQVSGTIQKLGADFNTVVTPGQMIAQIDPRPFQAAVDQARANLLVARANTRKARASAVDARSIAKRTVGLADDNLVSRQQADTTVANAAVADAAVEASAAVEVQAKAALDAASLNLAFTTIVSPIRGTVITRNVDVGQTVAASFSAPTLFLIGEDLTQMQVDTNIAEADVGRLAPRMVATFTVDAFPTQVFHGTIREIRNSPQVIQNVVTYDAVIDVSNPDLLLKPGMTANLEVVYADRTDVVRVPNAGLRFHPPPELAKAPPPPLGTKLVWIRRGDQLVPVAVEPGASDGTLTEVRGGDLAPGDAVVTEVIK